MSELQEQEQEQALNPFGNAPAGAEGIQWGIDRMQAQGEHIDVPSLHTWLRAHDLMYGIEYIHLMIEMGRAQY